MAVHQVTALASLGRPGSGQPARAALMAKMRRKTLIVCGTCHDWILANPVARDINRGRARYTERVHPGFEGRLPGKGPGFMQQPTLWATAPRS